MSEASSVFGTPAPSVEDLLRQQNDRLRNTLNRRDNEVRMLRLALEKRDNEVASLSRALNAATGFIPTHRHVKRGTDYQEVAVGLLQTEAPLSDIAELVAYRDEHDQWWFRPVSEFEDGRFERIGVVK